MFNLNGYISYLRCFVISIAIYVSGCTSSNSICSSPKTIPSDRIEACGIALESPESAESHAKLLLERAKSYRLLTNSIPASSSIISGKKNASFTFSPQVMTSVKKLEGNDQNQLIKALEDLNNAESILPSNNSKLKTQILLERAEVNRLIGNLGSAKKDVTIASTLSPKNAEPIIQLALFSFDQGEALEGTNKLARALELEPDNLNARYYMMRQLQISGNNQKCIEHGEKATNIDANNTLILAMRARCLAALGNEMEALKELEKIHAIKPSEAIVYQDLAMVYLALDRPKDAAIAAESAILTDPSLPDAYFDWITALTAMKDYDKAISAYQIFKSTEIEDRIGIANNLAWELYLAGKYGFASHILQEWLEENPTPIDEFDHISNMAGYPIILDSLAHILAALGQADEAVALFLKASELGSDALKQSYRTHLTNLGFIPNTEHAEFVNAISACVNIKDRCKLFTE